MKLSVIIVNYNVCYFLEQCLASVLNAAKSLHEQNWNTEILVVDNNSGDNSMKYLPPRFPSVRFISNPENTGFGKANNLALAKAAGEYVLFLNPDTIVPENGLSEPIRFLEKQQNPGALGMRMLDGSGQYLPESKRGFPSPWVAFCKMTGLTGLFPTNRMFAGYYMGDLDPKRNHAVQILSGAYMLARKECLDKTGGFDEQFFMYAEDIDLSYRISQLGYINYYFAGTPILHFKGESTRKDSRYVKLFYTAMVQFVRKHFDGGSGWLYRRFLETGIWLRASLSFLKASGNATDITPKEKKVFLVGDEASVKEVTELVSINPSLTLADEHADATTVVYCQGSNMSCSEMIFAAEGEDKEKMFHLQGTRSVVGSGSSDGQGEVWHFPE